MDSSDLPDPHPGDPWHPAWDSENAAPDDEHGLAADAAARVHEIVRRLDADEELRLGLEAAATGRRMLDQIAAVRDGTPSALFADVEGAGEPDRIEVAPADRVAVPESANAPRRRRLGRLRRSASRIRSAAGGDEEEVTNVVDERRDDERDERSEDVASDPADTASSPTPSDDVVQPELGDDEDFPWDDEDWSTARSGDEPEETRELDLVTPGVDPAHVTSTADEIVDVGEPRSESAESPQSEDGDADDEPVADEPADVVGEPVDAGVPVEPMAVESIGAEPEPDVEPELDDEPDVVDEPADVVDGPLDAGVPVEAMAVEETAEPELDVEPDVVAPDVVAPDVVAPDVVAPDVVDPDVTLELEPVPSSSEDPTESQPPDDAAAPEMSAGEEDAEAPEDLASEEGVFTHAEVIPLVRPPQAHEATAGLDPDLLAMGEDADAAEPETGDEPMPAEDAAEGAGDAATADEPDEASDAPSGDGDEFAAFTLEEYTGTATEEYAELARAMAASEDEALEPAAISAEMPGLDTSLVGLDDVVDAGIGVTETLSTTRRSDLGLRVATAVGLLIVFFGSLLWPWAIGGLILVVLGVAALELYIVTVNAGYRPLTWAGLVGVVGALAGTWVWGVVAIPIALALTAIGATLFLALSAERRTPLLDLALTIAMMAWVGVLGAPAFEIVEAAEYRWLILAVVLTTAFMDVAQYFVGRALGRRKLAPVVSPKKTIEGLVGGVFTALVVGVVFGSIEASPFDPGSGLAFGAVVAVVAPLGDLAVSVVKRALGVKDMSAILPGHGGIMDRIDAMVFVIPSAWIVFRYFDLLG